jgi:hypothetical protein
MKTALRSLCSACALGALPLAAETISWFSDPMRTNLDGSGTPMDAAFQFELGVFANGFVPTDGNHEQWQIHWSAAQTANYNSTSRRFAESYDVKHNPEPFTAGASAWIMGRRDTATGSERILLRNSNWLWPAPNALYFSEWNAKDADIIVTGELNGGGSPFLMRSATLQSFDQWRTEHLAGETLDGPADDADRDGTPNLLEFVFGTPPLISNKPTQTPVSLLDGHLQITIPRRPDRPATLVVEVSNDLIQWSSGPAHTEIASDGPAALVVRDLTPLDSVPHRKRFIRLRAVLP